MIKPPDHRIALSDWLAAVKYIDYRGHRIFLRSDPAALPRRTALAAQQT